MVIKQLLIDNYLVFAPFLSYMISQILKFIINAIVQRKIDMKRIVGSGGMPSSHSASVAALATASLVEYGPKSPITAITLVLAVVVVYDAMGVRKEVGRQAEVLNEMSLGKIDGKPGTKKLNTMVGHTKSEVIFGIILGTVVTACARNLVL